MEGASEKVERKKVYAEVIVNLSLKRRKGEPPPSFHYLIPEEMRDQAEIGRLVLVPFGSRLLQGIIVDFPSSTPVEKLKPLEAILDVAILPHQIALARWISEYYLAPINEALALMLPPGLGGRAGSIIELNPQARIPPDLGEDERSLIEALRRHKSLDARRLDRILARRQWRKALKKLLRKGIVFRRPYLSPPRVSPRRVHYAILRAKREDWDHLLEPLAKSSAEADVLEFLARSEAPILSVEQVCQAAGCAPSLLKRMEKKGLVRLLPARKLVFPAASREKLQEALEKARKRAPVQARVLETLLENPAPVPVDAITGHAGSLSEALRALARKGLVQVVEEEPSVLLELPADEALERAEELRGLSLYRRILEVLEREGGPVACGDLYAETGCAFRHLRRLEEAGLLELVSEERARDPLSGLVFEESLPPELTEDQERVWKEVKQGIESGGFAAYLLFGVTGSGKTEIYLRAIEATLDRGRQAIVLVPEIALTPQTVQRFASRFPGRVAVLHSQLSLGERFDTWRRIRRGEVDIVIGPRSAVFAPLPRIGLVVVDEEHERSYKSQKRPYYHARDVALELGRQVGAVVILGSATPDVVTFSRARKGELRLLELPRRILWRVEPPRKTPGSQRPSGSSALRPPEAMASRRPGILTQVREGLFSAGLPPVQVVDMREELKAGHRGIFSRALLKAMEESLDAGEQVILFLNRRGAATFVMCRDCGFVLKCRRCDVPLTYHAREKELVCHHCNRRYEIPSRCPACGSRRIRYFGLGTERVEREVQRIFPGVRTIRWDRDTTVGKFAHRLILEKFASRQADVLVGTQMIAKGLDLPYVTLVGVVSADTALHLPDPWAAERTFQLLAQVAGRAGRSILGGRVIIQTYTPEHYAIRMAARHDYEGFYERELNFRRAHGYPPYSRLARLLYTYSNEVRCQEEAEKMRQRLVAAFGSRRDVRIIGPAPCFFKRLRGRYRWQIVVLAPEPSTLLRDVVLPEGWRVEVDPVTLL